MRLALATLAILAAAPALAQDDAMTPEEDCAFLQRSFSGVYDGLRQMAGGDVESADPAVVTMFTTIQTNIILMAQSADCDMAPMIEAARGQLERYAPAAVE